MKNKKFIWSVSSCAFQIEGGRNQGSRTDSIWDEFTKRNYYVPPIGVPEREINSIEVAADFYSKYQVDAKIMKNGGINGFTYNLDWTRIYSKNGETVNSDGIQWTDSMFKSLVKNRVKPIPILFHWDTPLWAQIQGGWENPKIIEWFKNYATTMFKYFGKYTDIWFVSDENSSFTLLGYLNDYFPPGRKNKTAFANAIHNLNLAAAVTKQEFLKAKKLGYLSKDAILGITHDWNPPIPYDVNDEQDIKACDKYNEWFLHFWLDPNMKGQYPQVFYDWIKENDINLQITQEHLDFLKKYTLDFIGWNYYRPCYVTTFDKYISDEKLKKPSELFFTNEFKIVYPIENVKYTNWNWIIDSSQLKPGSKKIQSIYGNVPLMIVENGIGAFDDKSKDVILDTYRIEYLKDHIEAVLSAKEEGVNFIGYSLWTYCDIFSPSGGYRKDYGLISVDFNSKNKERKPKLSYCWYKQVAFSDGKDTSFDLEKLKLDLQNELSNWDIFKK